MPIKVVSRRCFVLGSTSGRTSYPFRKSKSPEPRPIAFPLSRSDAEQTQPNSFSELMTLEREIEADSLNRIRRPSWWGFICCNHRRARSASLAWNNNLDAESFGWRNIFLLSRKSFVCHFFPPSPSAVFSLAQLRLSSSFRSAGKHRISFYGCAEESRL